MWRVHTLEIFKKFKESADDSTSSRWIDTQLKYKWKHWSAKTLGAEFATELLWKIQGMASAQKGYIDLEETSKVSFCYTLIVVTTYLRYNVCKFVIVKDHNYWCKIM